MNRKDKEIKLTVRAVEDHGEDGIAILDEFVQDAAKHMAAVTISGCIEERVAFIIDNEGMVGAAQLRHALQLRQALKCGDKPEIPELAKRAHGSLERLRADMDQLHQRIRGEEWRIAGAITDLRYDGRDTRSEPPSDEMQALMSDEHDIARLDSRLLDAYEYLNKIQDLIPS